MVFIILSTEKLLSITGKTCDKLGGNLWCAVSYRLYQLSCCRVLSCRLCGFICVVSCRVACAGSVVVRPRRLAASFGRVAREIKMSTEI